jgi:hypothetical protein
MKAVSRYLQSEWEQVTCAVAALLLLILLASWATRERAVARPPGAGRITESPAVIGPHAFAFLQDPETRPAMTRNPFLCSAFETQEPRQEKAVPPPPPKPAPPAPTPVQPAPVAPPPAPVVTPAPAPAAPAPRLSVYELKYAFSTTNRSGRLVALIELRDPARPNAAPLARNVSAGDQVCGLRIQGFTDQTLTLVDASGRRQSVSFGGTRRVAVNMGTAP